jgi:hypothetical protein
VPCRYETTVALPIEYGTVTAVDVLSGLIFYREDRAMSTAQLTLVVAGCATTIVGIVAGLFERRRTRVASAPAAAELPRMYSREAYGAEDLRGIGGEASRAIEA